MNEQQPQKGKENQVTTTIRITRAERGEPKQAPGFAGALGATNASETVEEVELVSEAEDITVKLSSLADAFSAAFNEPLPERGPSFITTEFLGEPAATEIVSDEDQAPDQGADDVDVAWGQLQPGAAYYFTDDEGIRRLGVYLRDVLEDREAMYYEGDVTDIRFAAPAPQGREF